jgi:tetratricopeptide (TPR) repeat protein
LVTSVPLSDRAAFAPLSRLPAALIRSLHRAIARRRQAAALRRAKLPAVRTADGALRPSTVARGGGPIFDGPTDRRIKLCDDTLARDPTNGPAWHRRGQAYEGRGEFHVARADYGRALACAPYLVGAHADLAQLLSRPADDGLRNLAAARRHAEKAVLLSHSATWWHLYARAMLAAVDSQWDQAVRTIARAAAAAPDVEKPRCHALAGEWLERLLAAGDAAVPVPAWRSAWTLAEACAGEESYGAAIRILGRAMDRAPAGSRRKGRRLIDLWACRLVAPAPDRDGALPVIAG